MDLQASNGGTSLKGEELLNSTKEMPQEARRGFLKSSGEISWETTEESLGSNRWISYNAVGGFLSKERGFSGGD